MKHTLLTALAVLLFLSSCTSFENNSNHPVVRNGVIDLSTWNFEKDGPVQLNGEWEFYWERFIEDGHFDIYEKEKLLAPVPKLWNNYSIDGREYGRGFATFRVTVKLPDSRDKLGLKITEINTAHRLYVNSELSARAGEAGFDRGSTVPKLLPEIITLPENVNTMTLTVHVSNFHYNRGGIQYPIVIGTRDDLVKMMKNGMAIDFFLFGSLLIMSLYHFGFYLLRRKDLTSLLFAFFCFFICIRVPATGEIILAQFWPDFPFFLNFKLKYMSFPALPLFFSFIYIIFRNYAHRTVSLVIFIPCIILGASVFVVPLSYQGYFMEPYLVVTIITSIYVLYILFRAALNAHTEAYIVLAGFTILFVAILNDLLMETYQIYLFANILPIGVFLFILSQSFVLSLRFSRAFSKIEEISGELKEKNEALVRYDRMKDDFLAGTSHELRTPLSGMIGIAETLRDTKLRGCGEEVADDLSVIVSSGKRLSSMINGILDFSRLKYDTITLAFEKIDLYNILSEHLALMNPLIRGKNIVITSGIKQGEHLFFADRTRLSQILHNLIGNAVKFTLEGEIAIFAENEETMVAATIRDTGIGIPAERLDSIFDPYQQADESIARQFGGTGLGLTITKHLIELHGGAITLNSEEGTGTEVRFSLPRYTGQEVVEILPVADTVSYPAFSEGGHLPVLKDLITENETPVNKPVTLSIAGGTLLIVDDEPIILHVLKNILEADGHTVYTASTGEQGLKLVDIVSPDLVILDVMMPMLSGYDVAREIRKTWNLLELPLLMISARSQTEDIVSGFYSGINDYISKPFNKNELSARVWTLLEMKRGYVERVKLTNIEKDLEVARLLQKSIITKKDYYRALDGYDIDVRYYPVNNLISGDYYNIRQDDDGEVSIFLADATGHGIQAALFTSQIDVLYKDSLHVKQPHRKLEHINRSLISEIGTNNFFTAIHVLLQGDRVLYSGAGHLDQFIYRASTGTYEILKPRGVIIGMDLDAEYALYETRLEKGDILALFTDGVLDTELPGSPGNELFPDEAMEILLPVFRGKNNNSTSSELSRMIIDVVQGMDENIRFNDDITFIIISQKNDANSSA